MFGKPYAEYIRFQWPFLVAIAVVGLLRLILSIAGMPDSTVKFVSISAVAFVGMAYYGIRVGRSGFGTYRHLLPLVFNQAFLANAIAILGIGLSAAGMKNIYDAVEFRGPFGSPDTAPLIHALAHLFVGNTVGVLVGWGLASLVMVLFGRPKRAQATA